MEVEYYHDVGAGLRRNDASVSASVSSARRALSARFTRRFPGFHRGINPSATRIRWVPEKKDTARIRPSGCSINSTVVAWPGCPRQEMRGAARSSFEDCRPRMSQSGFEVCSNENSR